MVLLLPDAASVTAARRGAPTVYAPLRDALAARAYPVLDAVNAFIPPDAPNDVHALFMPGGHYSPAGNRHLALWLAPQLRRPGASAQP